MKRAAVTALICACLLTAGSPPVQAASVDEALVAQLYAQGLEQADRLYLTRVELSPVGDAWFPEVDAQQWAMKSTQANAAEGDKPAYHFEVWERR